MALAITPPISKNVPDVAAAPIRKKRASCAPGDTSPHKRLRDKIAAAPRQQRQTPNLADIVSPARQQFQKTTWITLNCNRASPGERLEMVVVGNCSGASSPPTRGSGAFSFRLTPRYGPDSSELDRS